MTEIWNEVVQATIRGLQSGPRDLGKALKGTSEAFDHSPVITPTELLRAADKEAIGGPLRASFGVLLAGWDYLPEATWTGGTPPSTAERRHQVCKVLKLTVEEEQLCNKVFLYFPRLDPITLIDNAKAWQPWYTADRRGARAFYWTAYKNYLTHVKKWDSKNIAVLDVSSTEVVERLADPEDLSARSRKGLVVGYVQSGKTSNFTGVMAKAADAGYRLFIVLAGMQNTLRDQTQRRLDKELVGRDLLAGEYSDAPDWSEFVAHGGRPSLKGGFDWERLTTGEEDLQELKVGVSALTFKLHVPDKPLRDPANLHRESARLIVVKKNPKPLDNLIAALKNAATHVAWSSVPALVIDDESDQASINTKRPKKEVKERTRINDQIREVLGILGGAQYVGYTATPFANVFVNPDDASDLFPSDFILALPRPEGYMGVADFYDEEEATEGDFSSNQNAFVRPVVGNDEKPENLTAAIDAFVLSGAIKIYRESNGDGSFRHHTMLVHNTTSVRVHKAERELVERLFHGANYIGGGPGLKRLEKLWNDDFRPVSRFQAETGLHQPRSFADLKPCIGKCFTRISQGEAPVIVLNGEDKESAPDFDREATWKIIVGGAKLSRGYTVEGLTVSYYRRRTAAADTLMQMGRWFGYRKGYKDLVRLYIGTKEPLGKKPPKKAKAGKGTINLYEAFRATCRDEEEFRAQLKRYSSLKEGERITPREVPPLVPSHMLQPSATNKMYNARLTFVNYGGLEIQRTMAPKDSDDRRHNASQMADLLHTCTLSEMAVDGERGEKGFSFNAITGVLQPTDVLKFLRSYRWHPGPPGEEREWPLVTEFLGGEHGSPEIDSWLLLAPLLKSTPTFKKPFDYWRDERLSHSFPIRERSRNEDDGSTRYLVYSDPRDIAAAKVFAGIDEGQLFNAKARALRVPRRAVFLFYPVLSDTEYEQKLPVSMGLVLLLPRNRIARKIAYTVVDQTQKNAVVVQGPPATTSGRRKAR